MGKRDEADEQLMQAARRAASNSHSPYSRFRVGAAVRGAAGVYAGANVENASYGLTLCAERAALAAAVSAGDRRISSVAIACIDASAEQGRSEKLPCGACLQWIQELAPEARILGAGMADAFGLDELLPLPFKLGPRE
jgi:cytidine deaminase